MDSEFWAAVVGAIVGSATGGLITWLLQLNQDRRQSRELNQGLARSLMFKLIRIYSDFYTFRKHIKDSEESAARDGLPFGWQSFRAVGNLPDKIQFSSDEMSYLLSLKNFDLFDKVLSLDVTHSSTIDILQTYKERRLALTDRLSATMDGAVGSSFLDEKQMAFFAPKAAELDLMVNELRVRFFEDERDSREALELTNIAISKTLGQKIELKFPEA